MTDKPLTKKQLVIMDHLKNSNKIWSSPTEIGMACGRDYNTASSWACHGLKSLVRSGLVVKNQGEYRLADEESP